jgi:hypothetical protein
MLLIIGLLCSVCDISCMWNNRCSHKAEKWQGKPKNMEKMFADANLSTTNPTWLAMGLNLGQRGGSWLLTAWVMARSCKRHAVNCGHTLHIPRRNRLRSSKGWKWTKHRYVALQILQQLHLEFLQVHRHANYWTMFYFQMLYCTQLSDDFIMASFHKKMNIRFRLWNVRSLYRAGSLMIVSKELSRYKLDLAGVH